MTQKREEITPYFRSNCTIQAFKAKLKDPKHVKLYFLPPQYTESPFPCPHFLWTDGKYDYDFGVEQDLTPLQVLFFKGCIRRYRKGFAKKYIAFRKYKYEEAKKLKKEGVT